jgi:hypothetical protein
MTDSEINKIIAEYIQWKPAIIFRDMTGKPFEGWDIPPDYCRDLNAMHEAEKTLSRGQNYYQLYGFGFYITTLTQICYQQHILTATASQRAEAFVRTIDKWKD